jgi:hypothetical protein
MNRALQEKRTLAEMARRFGQEPTPRLLAEIAELEDEEQQRQHREAELRERITADLTEIFGKVTPNELVQSSPPAAPTATVPDATVLTETPADPQLEINIETPRLQDAVADYLSRQVRESTVVNPEPVLAQPQKDLEREVRYLKEWVSRIAATGPGGGAAQIYNLDIPAKSVTGDYTIGRKDYYIGVSSTVKTYITLPAIGSNVKEGRVVVIKDESGHAQLTPIAIVGTIDNDPNGAEIRINNGAVQLVYHNNGWRII